MHAFVFLALSTAIWSSTSNTERVFDCSTKLLQLAACLQIKKGKHRTIVVKLGPLYCSRPYKSDTRYIFCKEFPNLTVSCNSSHVRKLA